MNIVVIVMDTVRADCGGPFFGENDTPSTASPSDGTNFQMMYSSAPWTLPSHASLFTGTPPSKHNAHAGHKYLDKTLITLPEILQAHGYETVGVSNNTWISGEFGFDRGFEAFYKTWQYVQSDTDLGRIARQEEGLDKITKATKALFDGNPITNLTNAVYGQFFRKNEDDGAAHTNEWIRNWLTSRGDSRPFFLFINYLEPHLEYRPLETHAEEHLPDGVTYQEAMDLPQDAWEFIADNIEMTDEDFEILQGLYQAEIAYLEEKIEELVQLLIAEGEWDETLFIITSDHGEHIGEHGLMDHQYALYDTLLNVPLYVHGGPFDNDEIDDFVQLLDIPPTIVDVLDFDVPEAREQFQGISFHPDADETREYVVAEYMAPQPSIDALEKRVGELPEAVRKYNRSLRSIRTDQYKYIRGSDGSQELYDIRTDPSETTDLSGTHEDVLSVLDTKLNKWLDSFDQSEAKGEIAMSEDTKARLEDLGYLQ